ncbi:hypothetical protein SAMN04488054_11325 [Salibacterium qingdaonense]|uniref:Uncharacterized protein n=1 Tax=Salibacterium qingdaonense TaxID=266892 RepID=A0A1I4MRZ3_9BACI|nr:hypothetical protein SAMN04488054_11325 [Salibacterium qingdaonense]
MGYPPYPGPPCPPPRKHKKKHHHHRPKRRWWWKWKLAVMQILLILIIFQVIRTLIFPTTFDVMLLFLLTGAYLCCTVTR